jgi:ribose transport system substrate-binding protein
MKHVWLVLCVLLVLGLGGGCRRDSGESSGGGAGPGDGPPVRGTIGVSLLTLDNPFFKVIGDNITREGAKHGYETIVLDAKDDAARQSNQIEDLIVQKVSVIVLSPKDTTAIVPAITKANQAGIPVITVDIPCYEEGIEILTQVATDNEEGGREAGRAIIELLGETGGKVAILHKSDAQSCILRVKGFRSVIDAHNESADSKVEIVGEYPSDGDKALGRKATLDAMQNDSDIRAIFAINDPAALGARAALEAMGIQDQVRIVGFDGQPEGKQAIKDGKIYADPIQFPDQMGIKVVESIVAYFNGEEVPPEQLIPTKLYKKEDAENDPALK